MRTLSCTQNRQNGYMRTLSCTRNRQNGYMRTLSCTQNRQNGYMRPPLSPVPSPLSPFTQPNMLKKHTLFEIRHLRESEDRVEFKKANQGLFSYNGSGKSKATDRRKCILGYVVALCNEGGGELIFGVDDAYPHRSKTKTSTENTRPKYSQTTSCEPTHWEYVQNASKTLSPHKCTIRTPNLRLALADCPSFPDLPCVKTNSFRQVLK